MHRWRAQILDGPTYGQLQNAFAHKLRYLHTVSHTAIAIAVLKHTIGKEICHRLIHLHSFTSFFTLQFSNQLIMA